MRARVFKFCIHTESAKVYCVTENKTEIYSAFFFFFSISHSNVIHREICDKYFSGTIAHRIFNLVQVVWIICCFMGKNQIPPTYLPIISSFFFLSNFQISNNFISSFLRDWEAHKVETWSTHGQRVDLLCTLKTSSQNTLVSLFFFFFLSLQLAKIKNLLLQIVSTYLWWLRPGICELCSLSAIFFTVFMNYTTMHNFRLQWYPPCICIPLKKSKTIIKIWSMISPDKPRWLI